MTDTATLERIKALVGHTFGDDAKAVLSCLRTLTAPKDTTEKWLSIARACNGRANAGDLLSLLERLADKP